MKLIPVILCGGSGTRLWPMSREHYPKQLLSLVGSETLLQSTVNRIMSFADAELLPPVVVSNDAHRFQIAEQIRDIRQDASSIILEPVGRNTAPALSIAAEYVRDKQHDAMMMVMPADHVIKDVAAFHRALREAVKLAEDDKLVTFGIVPHSPETGYGYIKKGAASKPSGFDIATFVEKPDLATAQGYLDSGEYLWNSGMFLMKASVWLKAMDVFRKDIAESCLKAYSQGRDDYDFYRLDEKVFKQCPSDSIDYAVMEKITQASDSGLNGVVVPLDAGWSDVGSWDSLWAISEKTEQGNVVLGDVYLENTRDSIVHSSHRMVAVIGLENVIVVETPDAVLVADKASSQDVKTIVGRLKAEGRSEAMLHRNVYRPWGNYEGVDQGERHQVKRITVRPGARLSLQMHHHRAEHWIVVKGTAKVTRGEETFLLSENQSTYIPIGVNHRLENPGTIPLEIIEVQSGSYLGEDDIVRFEDIYGRKDT